MQSIDPVLVSHWLNLLKVLGESHNLFGPASLHDLVVREMSVIRQHRLAARSALAVNLLRVEAQWAEFASWTGDNLGDLESARLWLDHALALASESEDSQFVGYVLMRLAQQAADRQDAGEASSLADVARNKHEMSLRDQALCAVREAQGHALAADLAITNRKLSLAYELVSRADDADAEQSLVTFGKHCVSAYVQAHEGYCHLRLGRPQTAIRILEEALATWPASYPQDESLARAWLATAYAELGQIPEAAAEGTKAVDLGLRASSARTTRVLRQLDRRFSAHSMLAEVTAFHTAYITASGSARRS